MPYLLNLPLNGSFENYGDLDAGPVSTTGLSSFVAKGKWGKALEAQNAFQMVINKAFIFKPYSISLFICTEGIVTGNIITTKNKSVVKTSVHLVDNEIKVTIGGTTFSMNRTLEPDKFYHVIISISETGVQLYLNGEPFSYIEIDNQDMDQSTGIILLGDGFIGTVNGLMVITHPITYVEARSLYLAMFIHFPLNNVSECERDLSIINMALQYAGNAYSNNNLITVYDEWLNDTTVVLTHNDNIKADWKVTENNFKVARNVTFAICVKITGLHQVYGEVEGKKNYCSIMGSMNGDGMLIYVFINDEGKYEYRFVANCGPTFQKDVLIRECIIDNKFHHIAVTVSETAIKTYFDGYHYSTEIIDWEYPAGYTMLTPNTMSINFQSFIGREGYGTCDMSVYDARVYASTLNQIDVVKLTGKMRDMQTHEFNNKHQTANTDCCPLIFALEGEGDQSSAYSKISAPENTLETAYCLDLTKLNKTVYTSQAAPQGKRIFIYVDFLSSHPEDITFRLNYSDSSYEEISKTSNCVLSEISKTVVSISIVSLGSTLAYFNNTSFLAIADANLIASYYFDKFFSLKDVKDNLCKYASVGNIYYHSSIKDSVFTSYANKVLKSKIIDGSIWYRIFHHKSDATAFTANTILYKPYTETSESFFSVLEKFRRDDGCFEFMINYPGTPINGTITQHTKFNRWRQSNNPVMDVISGFKPIYLDWSNFNGLSLTDVGFFVKDVESGMFEIGTKSQVSGFKGPDNNINYTEQGGASLYKEVELWVRGVY